MLDWQSNLVDAKDRKTILLADVQEGKLMAEALCVGNIEMKAIDDIFDYQEDLLEGEQPSQNNVPKEADHDLSVLAGFSPLLDEREMYQRLLDRG